MMAVFGSEPGRNGRTLRSAAWRRCLARIVTIIPSITSALADSRISTTTAMAMEFGPDAHPEPVCLLPCGNSIPNPLAGGRPVGVWLAFGYCSRHDGIFGAPAWCSSPTMLNGTFETKDSYVARSDFSAGFTD